LFIWLSPNNVCPLQRERNTTNLNVQNFWAVGCLLWRYKCISGITSATCYLDKCPR
jgi:hypothetical protein